MAILASGLLPASFRGVPFAVVEDDVGGGRRIALHQYPGRDTPWAEDMGRAARQFRLRGFIVDGDVMFAGGPILLQRAMLLAALEKSGSGLLIHPTLGAINVSVPRFSVGADLGAGRMASLQIEFVESGEQTYPSILSSSSGLLSAANLCRVALAIDGIRAVALAAAGGGTRDELSASAAVWSSQTVQLGRDATALHKLAAQLPGNFGRYAAGGNAGIEGKRATIYTEVTTIADLVTAASSAREAIRTAAYALAAAASTVDLGYAQTVAESVVTLINALSAACADPADAIRLLENLIAFMPNRPETASPIGLALAGMIRRAAASALTAAAGTYQPASADDAAGMIARLGADLDAQATLAADAGDDASYSALRGARGAIVKDLRARGSTLALVKAVQTAQPAPSLVLAQRLYRDAARAEQLVTQANPLHPLFMPTRFQALAA